MRISLRIIGVLAALSLVLVSCSGAGASSAKQSTTTRSYLLTMWGMKPYEVPNGETAKSIILGKDGTNKWANLPIGPEGATFATVHHFVPDTLTVNQGDTVKITVLNLGLHHHGFAIPDYGIDMLAGGSNITPEREDTGKGKLKGTSTGGPTARTVTFVADKAGIFHFMCNLPYNAEQQDCNPLHDRIIGELVVLPR